MNQTIIKEKWWGLFDVVTLVAIIGIVIAMGWNQMIFEVLSLAAESTMKFPMVTHSSLFSFTTLDNADLSFVIGFFVKTVQFVSIVSILGFAVSYFFIPKNRRR